MVGLPTAQVRLLLESEVFLMTSRASAARAERAPVRARKLAQVSAMVGRFPSANRVRLDRLIAMHSYFEDLLWSFPGLAHAITCGAYDEAACARACAIIRSGCVLQHAARELGVPFWLRRLPPEAFCGPIPPLPSDADFGLKVCNHLPRENRVAATWLQHVSLAYRVCDAKFALWTARNFTAFQTSEQRAAVAVLALLAWHADMPHEGAGLYVPAGWTPRFGAIEACRLASRWLCELQMVLYTQARASRLAMANDANEVCGITFVRLRTPQELAEEGSIMKHCVATYAPGMAKGRSFLWSLRDECGSRIATLEVCIMPNGRPRSAQLRAVANADVPHRVWQAVQVWLGGWSEPPPATTKAIYSPDARTWAHLWKPYWRAKGMGALLPLRPPAEGLDPLHDALLRLCG